MDIAEIVSNFLSLQNNSKKEGKKEEEKILISQ
jgi:hypothetical protein